MNTLKKSHKRGVHDAVERVTPNKTLLSEKLDGDRSNGSFYEADGKTPRYPIYVQMR